MRVRALLATLAGLVVSAAVGGEAAETVALRAADGTALSAVWLAPARPAPAVVLVHMLTRSHHDWDQAAEALNTSGFGVLALDLRGHGASSGTWASGLAPMQQDVQAAADWLKARSDVISGRIGIAGASLGATLAALVAASDGAIRSLALLSPSAEYRGVRCEAAVRKFAERSGAMMLVAASGDPYALRTVHAFESLGTGSRDLRVIDGTSAHGTTLLDARPDLVPSLVDWFRRSLL